MAVKYIDFTNDQMRQMLALQPKNMAMQTQAQPTVTTQSQPQQKGGLEGFLGGLGQTIGNVGTSLAGLFGGGVAAVRDLAGGSTSKTFSLDEMQDTINKNRNVEGVDQRVVDSYQKALDTAKANGLNQVTGYWDDNGLFKLGGEGKNQSEFKKWLYGENENTGTANYAKAAGQALDAAATVSNFIPGANGLVGNTIQGAAGAFGQNYADTGGDLESALKAAVAGGAAGLATGGLNKGLNNTIAKGGKLANLATSKPLASTIVRGGLSGAVGGAVGGGTAAGLNNGDILAGATQGAISGAKGGAIAAPVMTGANKIASKIPGIGGAQAALNEMEQDYQTRQQLKKLPQQIAETTIPEEPVTVPRNNDLPEDNTDANSKLMYGESELANGNTSKASLGKKIATTLEGAQANLTRKEARDIGIESAGKAIDKTYKRTGITDLQRQAMLANELTGAQDSLLDTIQRTALSATEDGKPRYIDITPVIEDVDSIVDSNIPKTALSGTKRQQLIDDIKADLSNTGIDTITKANNIRSMAMEYSRKAKLTPDIGDSKTAAALFQIADKVDDMSYKAVPKDQVDAMYETAISELKGRAKVAKQNGVKDAAKAYTMLADELSNTERTIENYRTFKKDFVNSNKIYTKTAQGNTAWNYNAGTIGAAILGAAITGNPLVGVPAALLSKSLAIPAGEAATQGLAKLGGKISDLSDKITAKTPSTNIPQTSTATSQVPSNLYNLIGQKQGSAAASDTLEAQLANMNTNEALQATQNGLNGEYYTGADVYGNATTPTANTGIGGMYGSPYSQNDDYLSRIEIGIQNAFNAGDFKSVEYLIDMYNSVSKMYQTNEKDMSNPMNWSSADKKSLLEAQDWLSKIDDLEAVYNQAGGAKGSGDMLNIGGRIADFTADINANKEGKNYQSYANSIGMGIIKSLVNMGGTEYDAERYLDYLPKLSDTKEQAKQKLDVLRNSYQSVINNLYRINQL